jgi:predicted hydrocarbon binding protein
MLSTVDALLPLSLLEAVRDVDTPEGDYDAEYVAELKSKRLGLSDTVYTQIRRYTEADKKRQRTAQDEAVALAKLIGRRADAEAVFRAAGRHLARDAYQTIPEFSREVIHVMPSFIARPMALRRARRIMERYLNGNLQREGSSLLLQVDRPVTLEAAPGEVGCVYYEAALRELLELLVGAKGAVEHVRCTVRGEGSCAWRADWRKVAHDDGNGS